MSVQAAERKIYGCLFDLHSNHTEKVGAFSYISHAGGVAEFSISVWVEMGLLYLDKLFAHLLLQSIGETSLDSHLKIQHPGNLM